MNSVHMFELADVTHVPDEFLSLSHHLHIADHVVSKGRGEGSLEDESTAGLDYRVLTGGKIQTYLPWLWDLYTDRALIDYCSRMVGQRLFISNHLTSCVNVNYVTGMGGRYELHVDSQPYTLLVFASTLYKGDGGELVVQFEGSTLTVRPRYGLALLFDGSLCPHMVLPLEGHTTNRVSVPMVYSPADVKPREDKLDHHLYGGHDE